MKVKAKSSILFIAKVAILSRCCNAEVCQFSPIDCIEFEGKINEAYYEGRNICSANQNFQLGMTRSGDLCVCDASNPNKALSSEIWCANISGGDYMILQNDGNVVAYQTNDDTRPKALWSTKSAGNRDSSLRISNEGAAILSSRSEKILWSSPEASTQTSTTYTQTSPQYISQSISYERDSNIVTFYVVGDTPYQSNEFPILTSRIKQLPSDANALVHVGDIKKGSGASCSKKYYESIAKELNKSHAPVFIVPGDNDVNDCADFNIGWNNWASIFLSPTQLPERKWDASHLGNVKRQSGTANFAFICKKTLVVGVDITGGTPHDFSWWNTHYSNTVKWVMNQVEDYTVLHDKNAQYHAILILGHGKPQPNNKRFFKALKIRLGQHSKVDMDRVLYVHGDGHKPETNSFYGFNCVQVDLGSIQWLRLRVQADQKEPFEYKHGVFLE